MSTKSRYLHYRQPVSYNVSMIFERHSLKMHGYILQWEQVRARWFGMMIQWNIPMKYVSFKQWLETALWLKIKSSNCQFVLVSCNMTETWNYQFYKLSYCVFVLALSKQALETTDRNASQTLKHTHAIIAQLNIPYWVGYVLMFHVCDAFRSVVSSACLDKCQDKDTAG